MSFLVLFSGGKDSNYAIYQALEQGLDVKCLLTIKSLNPESYMFHTPCVDLAALQAEAIGLPLIQETVSGVKEQEVSELESILSRLDVEGVVSGAIASEYQKSRLEKICSNLGLKVFNPLWGRDPEELMREIISKGFEVMVVGVAAYGLDEGWLGRKLSLDDVDELVKLNKKYGVHVAFEGGEAETLVLDAPMYKKRLQVDSFTKEMDSQWSGRLEVKNALLVDKP